MDSPRTIDPSLFAYLETYLTEARRARLREVIALRTRHLALVLDGIYQPHNISAVLRSSRVPLTSIDRRRGCQGCSFAEQG